MLRSTSLGVLHGLTERTHGERALLAELLTDASREPWLTVISTLWLLGRVWLSSRPSPLNGASAAEVDSDPCGPPRSGCSALSDGFFDGTLMEIGLDGVTRVSGGILGGVDGLDEVSTIVGVDVVSEGLRDVMLFVSENVLPGPL